MPSPGSAPTRSNRCRRLRASVASRRGTESGLHLVEIAPASRPPLASLYALTRLAATRTERASRLNKWDGRNIQKGDAAPRFPRVHHETRTPLCHHLDADCPVLRDADSLFR